MRLWHWANRTRCSIGVQSNPDDRLAIAYFLATWADPSLPINVNVGWMSQGGSGVTLFGSTPVAPVGIPQINIVQIGIHLISSHNTRIYLDPSVQNIDLRVLAMIVGHELYHAKQGRFSDSIEEEVQAYRREYSIGARLGVDVDTNPYSQYGKQFYNYEVQDHRMINSRRPKARWEVLRFHRWHVREFTIKASVESL